MAHYLVLRDCYCFNRLWQKGEEADLDAVQVPEHFKPMKTIEESIADRVAGQLAVEMAAQDGSGSAADTGAGMLCGNTEPDVIVNMEQMNIFTLQKMAREAGLDLPQTAKKQEIIAALRGE